MVKTLTKLVELNLSDCFKVGNEAIEEIASALSSLEKLYIARTGKGRLYDGLVSLATGKCSLPFKT